MGWMNDTLRYMRHEPIHRKYHHDELTFSLIYAFTENFVLPFSPRRGGARQRIDARPKCRATCGSGSPTCGCCMGTCGPIRVRNLPSWVASLASGTRWNCNTSLQWDLLEWESHQGLQNYVAHLNNMYRNEPALHQVDFDGAGFEWVDCHNHEDSIMAFLRRGKDPNDYVLVCNNFTPVPRSKYKIGVPEACWYEEISNSDSTYFGGSNVGTTVGSKQ